MFNTNRKSAMICHSIMWTSRQIQRTIPIWPNSTSEVKIKAFFISSEQYVALKPHNETMEKVISIKMVHLKYTFGGILHIASRYDCVMMSWSRNYGIQKHVTSDLEARQNPGIWSSTNSRLCNLCLRLLVYKFKAGIFNQSSYIRCL